MTWEFKPEPHTVNVGTGSLDHRGDLKVIIQVFSFVKILLEI